MKEGIAFGMQDSFIQNLSHAEQMQHCQCRSISEETQGDPRQFKQDNYEGYHGLGEESWKFWHKVCQIEYRIQCCCCAKKLHKHATLQQSGVEDKMEEWQPCKLGHKEP